MARRETGVRRDIFGDADRGIHIPNTPVNFVDTNVGPGQETTNPVHESEDDNLDFQTGRS